MKEFTIYFEIFGKKMKTNIFALTEERAKDRLRNMIVFHKVEQVPEKGMNGDFIDHFSRIFNGFDKK